MFYILSAALSSTLTSHKVNKEAHELSLQTAGKAAVSQRHLSPGTHVVWHTMSVTPCELAWDHSHISSKQHHSPDPIPAAINRLELSAFSPLTLRRKSSSNPAASYNGGPCCEMAPPAVNGGPVTVLFCLPPGAAGQTFFFFLNGHKGRRLSVLINTVPWKMLHISIQKVIQKTVL